MSLQLATDLPEPPAAEGAVLVQALAVGVCGTDRELVEHGTGVPPAGASRLVLGHESLGRVLADPSGTFRPGDLLAGVVRRPDPVPCPNCAIGEWDMCRNGRYTECGIKARDGFGRQRWRVPPEFGVRLDPGLGRAGVLLEPASVVAKAWEHVERIGARARWSPRTVLVTGAGPIGLLATLLATQRRLEVHVLDREQGGPKPGLVEALGATYHTGPVSELDLRADVILECTGAAPVIADVAGRVAPNGIIVFTGLPGGTDAVSVDIGRHLRLLVLGNVVVVGSVNANLRHWRQAAVALSRADPSWLAGMISRRVPIDDVGNAFQEHDGDVKVVVEFPDAG